MEIDGASFWSAWIRHFTCRSSTRFECFVQCIMLCLFIHTRLKNMSSPFNGSCVQKRRLTKHSCKRTKYPKDNRLYFSVICARNVFSFLTSKSSNGPYQGKHCTMQVYSTMYSLSEQWAPSQQIDLKWHSVKLCTSNFLLQVTDNHVSLWWESDEVQRTVEK